MASIQGQDLIRCQLCSNPVEHHCNLCHVDLCLSCIPKHMANKTRKHEVVEYTSRKKSTVVLPTCSTHKKAQCETYCQSCQIPICIQCLMGLHKKHEFTEIIDILQKRKKQIINDTKELETYIVPKYRNVNPTPTAAEFDKVLIATKEQADEICKAVREAGNQLTDEITREKKEATKKGKESKSLAEKAGKELNQIIQNNKDILRRNDVTAIIQYQSKNEDFRKGPELPRLCCPQLFPGDIKDDQITEMLGFLKTGDDLLLGKPGMLKMMDDPVVLSTIKSPYIYMQWRLQCLARDKILTSGKQRTIKKIDMTGSELQTIDTDGFVLALTNNLQQEPIFSLRNAPHKDINIYLYKNKVKVLFSIPNWCPVGLSYTMCGVLLVSMRSFDKTQSRVARYLESTEIQRIQYGSNGKPMFSTDVENVLLLTENGNGDICVADNAGKVVVVVDSSGGLRFKYLGNLSKQSKYTEFTPLHIATDVNAQILIGDSISNIVHIIDCDGNFIRYIEHLCDGGLSIDTDQNLVIADEYTAKIRIIKYLK